MWSVNSDNGHSGNNLGLSVKHPHFRRLTSRLLCPKADIHLRNPRLDPVVASIRAEHANLDRRNPPGYATVLCGDLP